MITGMARSSATRRSLLPRGHADGPLRPPVRAGFDAGDPMLLCRTLPRAAPPARRPPAWASQ